MDSSGHVLPNVSVATEYGLLSDDHYGTQPDNGAFKPTFRSVPAWIVTYTSTGVALDAASGTGSPGGSAAAAPQKVSYEVSYFVNAQTGAFMESID